MVFASLGKKQHLGAQVLAAAAVSRAGSPSPGPLAGAGLAAPVGGMTQCLAEAGRAGGGPQPAAEQARLCAGRLKRSFMTPLGTA